MSCVPFSPKSFISVIIWSWPDDNRDKSFWWKRNAWHDNVLPVTFLFHQNDLSQLMFSVYYFIVSRVPLSPKRLVSVENLIYYFTMSRVPLSPKRLVSVENLIYYFTMWRVPLSPKRLVSVENLIYYFTMSRVPLSPKRLVSVENLIYYFTMWRVPLSPKRLVSVENLIYYFTMWRVPFSPKRLIYRNIHWKPRRALACFITHLCPLPPPINHTHINLCDTAFGTQGPE